MAGLESVIRLRRWSLDEKRKALLALQAQEEAIVRDLRGLDADMITEQRTAREQPDFLFAYRGFADGLIQRRERLNEELEDVRTRLRSASREVADAFEELKKVEQVEEGRLEAEAREEAQREQAYLDELGLTQHRARSG